MSDKIDPNTEFEVQPDCYRGNNHIVGIELKPSAKRRWWVIFTRVDGTTDRHSYSNLDKALDSIRIIEMLGGYKYQNPKEKKI